MNSTATTTTTNETTHTTALRDRVQERMGREGVSQRQLAKVTGLPHPLLSRWLSAKSRAGEEADVTAALATWMGGNAAPSGARRGDGFVPTPTAKRILGALAFARRSGDMACIYGGPGVGKTRAIQSFREADPENVWVATMTPACSGLVSALEVVAEAVGVTDCTGGARRIAGAIRAQVAGRKGIIVIDESQHLSMAAIEELRSIHDATGCGLALVGNETSYARLTGGARAASYAQIYSRLGMRVFLHRPEADDVHALARHMGVSNRDAQAFLERLAGRPGALRGVVKAVQLAQQMTKTRDVEVAALRDACRTLGAEV